MTDLRNSGDGETSPMGGGGRGNGDSRRLPPLGVDVVVALLVFGASVVNVAAQDGAGIPIAPM